MATTLTEQVNNLNKRIGALEDSGLDGKETITRITKIYGNVRVTTTITTLIHQYQLCSTSLICSESLII